MSGKGTMKNFKQMLGDAKLPERTVPICLRGDLVAEFEEAERELDRLRRGREDSLDAGSEIGVLADQIEALREQMRSETYTFRLRALPRRDFRALVAAHPPREEVDEDGNKKINQDDLLTGANLTTLLDDLIRRSVVDPDMSSDDWDVLGEKLTDQQFDSLSNVAWGLNRAEVDIPFSLAASRISRNSAPE